MRASIRLRPILGYVLGCLLAMCSAFGAPIALRTEFRTNPLGIDSPTPTFAWQSDNTERDWTQQAYQVLVATSAEKLEAEQVDVWDSGRRVSADSVGIAYSGPALVSQRRYFWTVRVWDHRGQSSKAKAPSWWETGLLKPEDWGAAKWISRTDEEELADRQCIERIWAAPRPDTGQKDPRIVFTRTFALRGVVRDAAIYLAMKTDFTAQVNGVKLRPKNAWAAFDRQDITALLRDGENRIEVSVANKTAKLSGLAGLVKIRYADGSIDRVSTDASWLARHTGSELTQPASILGHVDNPQSGAPAVPGTLPGPAARLRRDFAVEKPVACARLYVTALGSYRVFLNGARVGEDVLTPEFTNYRKRIVYQTYDVTGLVEKGSNAIAALLGDGWFGSALGWNGERFYFMPGPTRLLAKLHLEYADGTTSDIVTDGTWKASSSPILHSELYAGEVYDARLVEAGWNRAGFDDRQWRAAALREAPPAMLSASLTEPVRVVDTVRPRSVRPTKAGGYLFDMGQNMVGWVKLNARGPAGTRVELRFAEQVTPDGELSPENLRNANATDVYYLAGRGEETYVPYFTFHGFRYVEVFGYPGGEPPLDALVGEVISSVHRTTGRIETGNDLVNRMYDLTLWGQRGNFVSVPTDCPQRDERLGYTGDGQVFWRTGTYNADIAAFTHHFLRSVVDEQTVAGGFTNTAPGVPQRNLREGSPGWADAGIIIPWTAWSQFNDRSVIERHWNAMTKFMDYLSSLSTDYIRRKGGTQLGDWLNVNTPTPPDLIATGLWLMDAEMMREMAMAIGKNAEAERYRELATKIRAAFQTAYISETGVIGNGSQASYVLALAAGAVPDSLRPAAVANLVKDIEAHDWHLTTGFLSSPHLLGALSENGRTDVAYRLLLNESCPSWGYMIRQGATTWWERWNSDSSGDAMNSFNHYAFGSVLAWVYRNVAGIDILEPASGFGRILIRPRPDPRIGWARGEYDSLLGKIRTEWSLASVDRFRLKVTIPANTRAIVYLPEIPSARVFESGVEVSAKKADGWNVLEIGSGSYEFEVR